MLADTHCHLDFNELSSRLECLLLEMDMYRVGMLVVPSVQSDTWSKVIDICFKDSRFFFALGLHPYAIDHHTDECLLRLSYMISKLKSDGVDKLVAIGEIGLDFTRPNPKKQMGLFEAQLKLAEKYRLPVIIHVRKAHAEVLAALKRYELVGGVVHAFSGSYELMMSYVSLGLKIGVGPVITWPTSFKTKISIAKAPISSLVLETDSPDMSISGVKPGQGSPLDVCRVFAELKELRSETGDMLKKTLWQNSVNLFIR